MHRKFVNDVTTALFAVFMMLVGILQLYRSTIEVFVGWSFIVTGMVGISAATSRRLGWAVVFWGASSVFMASRAASAMFQGVEWHAEGIIILNWGAWAGVAYHNARVLASTPDDRLHHVCRSDC